MVDWTPGWAIVAVLLGGWILCEQWMVRWRNKKAAAEPTDRKGVNKAARTLTRLTPSPLPFFYGQCKQDEFCWNLLFFGQTQGVYVDIGAFDGIEFSNTYFFETIGWQGLCVEAQPDTFERLVRNRPNAQCKHTAITALDQEYVTFCVHEHGVLSYPQELREERHVQRFGEATKASLRVRNTQLQSLLDEVGYCHIDLLSLDIEGGELDVLKSLDWTRMSISVIDVENNWNDPAYNLFLELLGYLYLKNFGGFDQLWVHKDLVAQSNPVYLRTQLRS